MMAVDIATEAVFTAGRATLLFTGDYLPSPTLMPNYDVSREGRFLTVQPPAKEKARSTEIIAVVNWFEELKRLVPTK